MAINAIVDGRTFNGIETITTGGKTIALSETGGEGDSVGDLTEYNTVTVAGSTASNIGDLTVMHGLTKEPKIIIGVINKVLTAEDKGICIAFTYNGIHNENSYYGIYHQTNANTGNIMSTQGAKVDAISSVAQFLIDTEKVVIRKCGGNYNWDVNETYTFKLYA